MRALHRQGTPDKRHTSLKTQCGFKSSCTGYATGAHTRWLHSIYNGTSGERAASKEELLVPQPGRPSSLRRGMRQTAAARGAVLVGSPRQDATQRAAQKLEAGSVPKVQGTYPELAQLRAACWGTIMVLQ